jgi:ssDNA-binding Zn-finger/Zn-ribbon topoisomerase 1
LFGRKGYFLGCSPFPKCRGAMEAPPEILDHIHAATTATPS